MMMSPKEKRALDLFGKQLIEQVFDSSCRYLQGVMARGMNGDLPDSLHEAYASLAPASAEVLRKFVAEAVDQTLAQFLNFLDVHEIAIQANLENGEIVELQGVSDGLACEPYGPNGWIARFSEFGEGIADTSSRKTEH